MSDEEKKRRAAERCKRSYEKHKEERAFQRAIRKVEMEIFGGDEKNAYAREWRASRTEEQRETERRKARERYAKMNPSQKKEKRGEKSKAKPYALLTEEQKQKRRDAVKRCRDKKKLAESLPKNQ